MTGAKTTAAIAGLFLALTPPAFAHSWYTGLHNEDGQLCCGGSDCAAIGDNEVTPVPGGYQVHVRDFSPLGVSKGPINAFVPNSRAKPAKEGGEYHLCYWGGEVKCFFFPSPSY